MQQAWDKNGRIYYIDDNGNRVQPKSTLNAFQKLGMQAKASLGNINRWLQNADTNSQSYKDKVNLTLGLLTAPIGGSSALAAKGATALTPMVGRKIAQSVASNAVGGATGGAVEGFGRGIVENKNPLQTMLQDSAIGLVGGSALGGIVGKVGQGLAKRGLPNNPVAQQQYFADYVEGLSNNAPLGQVSRFNKGLADFRLAREGNTVGRTGTLYDKLVDNYNPEIEQIAKDYFGLTNNTKEAGYILNDGSLLDLSGKKFGGSAGSRSLDHREIVDAFLDNPNNANNLEIGFDEFIDNGAVRYMPESNTFFLAKMPSENQIQSIKNLLNKNNGETRIELVPKVAEWGLDNNFKRDYALWSDPNKIIDDIRTYFKGGKISDFKDYL